MKKHGGNVYAFADKHHINVADILDFSANINPLGLSESIKADMLMKNRIVGHYPDPDYVQLKTAIANFESVSCEQVIVGNGAIESLFILAEALREQHVVLQAPTFIEYERAFQKYGATIDYMPLNHEDFQIDFDALKEKDTDVVVICNPNNPTGTLTVREKLIDYLSFAKARSIKVIIDEAFIDFTDDEMLNTLVPYLNEYENLFVLKSLTKFFAMPGLRLGYLLTSNGEITDRIYRQRIPWTINVVAEQVAKISMKDTEYISATKAYIKRERQWMVEALKQIPYLKVFETQGNYIFFKSSLTSLDEKLAQHHIMIRNCSNYDNLNTGYFRVAIKEHDANMKLLKCMKEIKWKS